MKSSVKIKFLDVTAQCIDDSEDEEFLEPILINSRFNNSGALKAFFKNSSSYIQDHDIKSFVLLRAFTKTLVNKFTNVYNAKKIIISNNHVSLMQSHPDLEDILNIHDVDISKFYNTSQDISIHQSISNFVKSCYNVNAFIKYADQHQISLKNTKRLASEQPTFRGKFISRDTIYKDNAYYDINTDWVTKSWNGGCEYSFKELFATAMIVHRSNKRLIKDIESTTDLYKSSGGKHVTKNVYFKFPSTNTQVQESHTITVNAITSQVKDIGSYTDISNIINLIVKDLILINLAPQQRDSFYDFSIGVFRDNTSCIKDTPAFTKKIRDTFDCTQIEILSKQLSPQAKEKFFEIIDECSNYMFVNKVINVFRHLPNNQPYVQEIERQIIDDGLIKVLHGHGLSPELKQYEKFICNLTYLLFVCEPIRNPVTLSTISMFLDLVKKGYYQLDQINEYFPMSMENAVPYSNTLATIYNQCFDSKCYPTYYYATTSPLNAKELAKAEISIFRTWIEHAGKPVDNIANIWYAIDSLTEEMLGITHEDVLKKQHDTDFQIIGNHIELFQ